MQCSEASVHSCSSKKNVLKNFAKFTEKHLRWSLLFIIKLLAFRPATLLKKTPIQVFFYEYCADFKNSCFDRAPLVAASKCVDGSKTEQ